MFAAITQNIVRPEHEVSLGSPNVAPAQVGTCFKRHRAYMIKESLPRNAANKVVRPTLRNLINEAQNMGQAVNLQPVDAS